MATTVTSAIANQDAAGNIFSLVLTGTWMIARAAR